VHFTILKMVNSFDEQYKKEKCLWGIKSAPIVEFLLKHKKSGTVLDLGTGEGRNALFLAKHGFNVTAVDISGEGIKKLERLALENKVRINTFVKDIRNFNFSENYDVILSFATLHFLEKEEIERVIKKMKKHTSYNGFNVITVFTEENPNKNFSYLFKRNELKNYYSDWEILEYKERITPLEKHGKEGKPHRHGIAELIARKN